MRFNRTAIAGVVEVVPEPIHDERGFFARVWAEEEFTGAGIEARWVHENLGRNPAAGTLRGMHFQTAPWEETKLVRCARGRVFDVAVDLRGDSVTRYGWVGVELTADAGNMLVVPPGCAHGYLTLDADTDLIYKTTAPYAAEAATGVRHDDPVLDINWPEPIRLVSERDRSWALIEGDERADRRSTAC